MIFSKDVLFIHVPKTGGTSITSYLLQVLPHPVYYTAQIERAKKEPGIIWIPGDWHERLPLARELLLSYGYDILKFPLILATFRNPYDLEVSRYAYWMAGNATDSPSGGASAVEDFEGFACRERRLTGPGTLQDFFTLDGRIPPNLRILRFENLEKDLKEALSKIGIHPDIEFPHENTSRHADYRLYYTPSSEAAIYRKHKWAFDAGLCQRWTPQNSSEQVLRQELRDTKQLVRDVKAKARREHQELTREFEANARWAHELEAIIQKQNATIRTYQRALAPVRPLIQFALKLKKQLAARPKEDDPKS